MVSTYGLKVAVPALDIFQPVGWRKKDMFNSFKDKVFKSYLLTAHLARTLFDTWLHPNARKSYL